MLEETLSAPSEGCFKICEGLYMILFINSILLISLNPKQSMYGRMVCMVW